tara:strand:- start:126 stop:500 length:375 start_codon:yes stop_codon:yes gene_type:complete
MINTIFKYYLAVRQYLSNKIDSIEELVNSDSPCSDIEMEMNIDIETYNTERNYYDIDSQQSKQSKQSKQIRVFNCGYCSIRVNVPCLMYNDNTFCSNNCRNEQILYDNNSFNPYGKIRVRNYTI